MSYCSRSCRRRFTYWTSKVEHLVAFTVIFSNICTAQAQKRLFINLRCKFKHRRSIRRPRFPTIVQNFSDLATFSVDFCILYAGCPPYFYFRFVWPTDLNSIPHASTPTSIIPTRFEANMIIHSLVTAFLSADTSRDLVTLTFDLLTLNSCHTWRIKWTTLPPSTKTLSLSALELWVITFDIGYHWKCVRGHCACAESRDPWVGGQKRLHFWNPRPRFAYSQCNFYWAKTTIKGRLLSSVTNDKALDCVNFLCVTLTFDRLTLNSCVTWRVTWPVLPPWMKTPRLFLHELRVITVPID